MHKPIITHQQRIKGIDASNVREQSSHCRTHPSQSAGLVPDSIRSRQGSSAEKPHKSNTPGSIQAITWSCFPKGQSRQSSRAPSVSSPWVPAVTLPIPSRDGWESGYQHVQSMGELHCHRVWGSSGPSAFTSKAISHRRGNTQNSWQAAPIHTLHPLHPSEIWHKSHHHLQVLVSAEKLPVQETPSLFK